MTFARLTLRGAHDAPLLEVRGGALQMSNCTLRDTVNGSAVAVSGGTLDADGCRFEDNEAEQGAALVVVGGNVTATGCSFVRNAAVEGGAVAVLNPGAALRLSASELRANNASSRGGALRVAHGGDATLAGALDQGLYHTIAIAGDAKLGGDVNLWGEQAAFSAGGAVKLDGDLHLDKGYVQFYAGSLAAAGQLYMLYEAREC